MSDISTSGIHLTEIHFNATLHARLNLEKIENGIARFSLVGFPNIYLYLDRQNTGGVDSFLQLFNQPSLLVIEKHYQIVNFYLTDDYASQYQNTLYPYRLVLDEVPQPTRKFLYFRSAEDQPAVYLAFFRFR